MRTHLAALKTASWNLDRRATLDPNPRQRLLLRLASHRVKLAMMAQLDWLARLRVLEGVARIPVASRTWMKKFQRPGRGAEEILEALPGLPEEWVSAGDTGFYRKLHKALAGMFAKNRRPVEDVDDVLQAEIFGLYQRKMTEDVSDATGAFYSTGRVLHEKILSGRMDLNDIQRMVAKHLYVSEIQGWSAAQHGEVHLEDMTPNARDTAGAKWQFTDDIYKPLIDAITTSHDPLGADIIRYMTGFWADKNERADSKKIRVTVMNVWIKHLIATGGEMPVKQLAAVTGVPLSTAAAKVVDFKKEFKGKFWHQRKDLVEALEGRMEGPQGGQGPLSRLGSSTRKADAFLRSALLQLAATQPRHRLAILACCGQPDGREALMHKIDDRGAQNADGGDEDDDESGILSMFEEGKPADPTENMSPADAKEWRSQNKRNRDKFKARYEKGVSADPTENMSPEDAKEWGRQNDIHRDNFKSARRR